jgi:hypothetical protein
METGSVPAGSEAESSIVEIDGDACYRIGGKPYGPCRGRRGQAGNLACPFTAPFALGISPYVRYLKEMFTRAR